MNKIENPVYLALSARWFKEMGEDAFRNWCNSTITHTADEADTERLIAQIKKGGSLK